MSEEGERIELKHTKSDDYQLVSATNVHGGIQPQGNIKIDFTIDHNAAATSEYYAPEEEGRAVKVGTEYEDYGLREHRIGVTMTPADAFSAASWIIATLIDDSEVGEEDISELINKEYGQP